MVLGVILLLILRAGQGQGKEEDNKELHLREKTDVQAWQVLGFQNGPIPDLQTQSVSVD